MEGDKQPAAGAMNTEDVTRGWGSTKALRELEIPRGKNESGWIKRSGHQALGLMEVACGKAWRQLRAGV